METMNTPADQIAVDQDDAPDIFAELGALPAGAIVTEAAMARIFGRHPESVKRAVDRGELPAPARMFGSSVWTAGAIIRHLEQRLEAAAEQVEQVERQKKSTILKHSA
jgi:hypothetical protein